MTKKDEQLLAQIDHFERALVAARDERIKMHDRYTPHETDYHSGFLDGIEQGIRACEEMRNTLTGNQGGEGQPHRNWFDRLCARISTFPDSIQWFIFMIAVLVFAMIYSCVGSFLTSLR